MMTNNPSDWAVLVIGVAFLSLIAYAIIHGRMQAKKDQKEQNKGNDKNR